MGCGCLEWMIRLLEALKVIQGILVDWEGVKGCRWKLFDSCELRRKYSV